MLPVRNGIDWSYKFMITKNKRRLLWIFIVLILASLACRLPVRGAQETKESPPLATDALINPQVIVQTPGHISLTVDEAELTSMLAAELQKQQEPIIQDPQVYLREGQMKITGKVQQAGLTADLQIALTISVTQDGRLSFQLLSAQLGPFPLSQEIMDSISKQLDAAFVTNINPRFEDVFIESVTIANGQMVIQGHPR
jgi:uncharacterized protein YpmS